jgi:hypothetical protein
LHLILRPVDTTIAGVDYNPALCVGFEGDKLTVISEFAVKTVLEKFKMAMKKEAILLMMRLLAIDLEYTLLLTTLNIRCISYVAENSQTKEQYHVGTITYNTVLQKWMSEISEGNKSMAIGSGTYTTGFYDSARAGIWKETSLQILLQVNLSVPDFEELIMNTGLKLY